MVLFKKKGENSKSKKKKLTYEEAVEKNKATFEELMHELGFRKNGNDKGTGDSWEKHRRFIPVSNEEDQGEQ